MDVCVAPVALSAKQFPRCPGSCAFESLQATDLELWVKTLTDLRGPPECAQCC